MPPDRRDPQEELCAAYRAGLDAARLVRRYFPATFAEHLAAARATPARLLAVIELFLALADRDLIQVAEPCEFVFAADPLARFHAACRVDNEDALIALIDDGSPGVYLYHPSPIVFGLGYDLGEIGERAADGGRLVGLLWWLVRRTGWGVHAFEGVELGEVVTDPALAAAIAWNGLPAATDMPALAERLDAEAVAAPQLGTVLRFVCRQTGNDYADCSEDEAAEMGYDELDWWDADLLAAARQAQAAAETMARAYWALEDEVVRRSDALVEIAAEVQRISAMMADDARPDGASGEEGGDT